MAVTPARRAAFAAAVGAAALTLHGCGKDNPAPTPAPPAIPGLSGFYASGELKAGSLAGLYAVSDIRGDKPSDRIVVAGTDNGVNFWNVNGTWSKKANGAFDANFSSRGESFENQMGTASGKTITWQKTKTKNATAWTKMASPKSLQLVRYKSAQALIGGIWKDPNHYTNSNSFDGLRLISANGFPTLTMIGKDSASADFWTIYGEWSGLQGHFTVDFSPKGGPANLTGVFNESGIFWDDGNMWIKQGALPDIGGVYMCGKPNSSSLAGLNVVSGIFGKDPSDMLEIAGTDDGAQFWNVNGSWIDMVSGTFDALYAEWGPEFANWPATFDGNTIAWQQTGPTMNATTCTRVVNPSFEFEDINATNASIGGIYKDYKRYKDRSFDGMRLISANGFPRITFMGKDSASADFWTIHGEWKGEAGHFAVDFSPIGDSSNYTGFINESGVVLHDGKEWSIWKKQGVRPPSVSQTVHM